ncbi:hypothetical protein KCU61_g224, partial [Aureobasidium melanogenum]
MSLLYHRANSIAHHEKKRSNLLKTAKKKKTKGKYNMCFAQTEAIEPHLLIAFLTTSPRSRTIQRCTSPSTKVLFILPSVSNAGAFQATKVPSGSILCSSSASATATRTILILRATFIVIGSAVTGCLLQCTLICCSAADSRLLFSASTEEVANTRSALPLRSPFPCELPRRSSDEANMGDDCRGVGNAGVSCCGQCVKRAGEHASGVELDACLAGVRSFIQGLDTAALLIDSEGSSSSTASFLGSSTESMNRVRSSSSRSYILPFGSTLFDLAPGAGVASGDQHQSSDSFHNFVNVTE